MIMQNIAIKNHCYDCGKQFETVQHYTRHRNRKTPCMIENISEDQKLNPDRCIYCNKIFSKNSNLVRHLNTCKIKNGGLDKLTDKLQYEQKIRILEEKECLMNEKIYSLQKQMDTMNEKLKLLDSTTIINNFVYFICNENFDGKVKIGRSKNPDKRLKQLQTGNPNILKIYRLIKFDPKINMEVIIHKYFRDVNIINEWFELTLECMNKVCDSMINNEVQ